MKKLSYILVSRNDNYCGDSVGRLQTTLNHTGEILSKHGKLEESEVILTDWASPEKNGSLYSRLELDSDIKQILKIVEVSPAIAAKHQKDSPFSEVHAMNVGFRKSSGKFFGRIDQDTLIGERFVNWFYNEFHVKDYGFQWPLVAFSGRRNLSDEESVDYKKYIYDETLSKTVEICHPHNFYSRVIPGTQNMFLFYGGAVGILLVERNLYEEAKGFNEDFIYMNNMDTEFLNRLRDAGSFYNLGLKCDGDFYHLNHTRADGAAQDTSQPHLDGDGERQTNPVLIRRQKIVNQNPVNWGLNDEDLTIHTYG